MQRFLDSLIAAETTASKHNIRGPATSSNAHPLDGPFAGFELTPANEDAYYMHVAIRRAAAAARARADQEEKEEEQRGNGAVGGATASDRGARVDAAVKAAVLVASSPALLYTREEMGDEESLLRESLSAFKRDRAEEKLR